MIFYLYLITIVFSKPPFAGPEEVIRYIGRHTHRSAISNNRIIAEKDDRIEFWFKNTKTNAAYMNAIKSLAAYHRQSPDKLTNEQIQDYLHHIIVNRKLAWNSCNVQLSGIKRFYKNVLNCKTKLSIPPRPREKKIFMALSREEVNQILNACQNLKHYTLLLTVYSAGLRVSETIKLQPIHIERSRKMIWIEQGKGRKDRYPVLSDTLLKTLEEYWRAYRPGNWIKNGVKLSN